MIDARESLYFLLKLFRDPIIFFAVISQRLNDYRARQHFFVGGEIDDTETTMTKLALNAITPAERSANNGLQRRPRRRQRILNGLFPSLRLRIRFQCFV